MPLNARAQTQATEITVNVLGANGYLQGWIDWNTDDDFDDAGEQVALDVQDTDNDGGHYVKCNRAADCCDVTDLCSLPLVHNGRAGV